ncbi:hypothetical protein IGI37_000701 [Enterococcus sp. AZ194]|uniref:alpha/beta hydrolase family protein n=1 Tax=Enterococcus sp. AZ194 TaxID=2774629 RepID=UPI003F2215DF
MEKRIRPAAQNIGRILGGGMASEDFIKLMNATEGNIEDFTKLTFEEAADFVNTCEELGDRAVEYATNNQKLGRMVTASQYFFNASCLYRLGDYGIRGITDEKHRVYSKLLSSFRQSKELSVTEASEFVEIPFEGKMMPGYLLIPHDAPADVPVVICIPGATGYKEENYNIAYSIYERGCAALIFDGPGQGDPLLNQAMFLTADNYDRAVKAVINFIKEDPRLGDKIGLSGMSYGGYLATSAAAANAKDISAMVCRGGCSQTDQLTMHEWEGIDHFYLRHFMPKFNTTDLEEAKKISRELNVEPRLNQVTCSVLVVHSEEDLVLGVEGAKTIYQKCASADKEYYEVPGNVHCGNNEDQKTRAYAADWIVSRLMN